MQDQTLHRLAPPLCPPLRGFPNKWMVNEAPDKPGRLQKHTDNNVVVRFHIFFKCPNFCCKCTEFLKEKENQTKKNLQKYLTKQVITEAPDCSRRIGRRRKNIFL